MMYTIMFIKQLLINYTVTSVIRQKLTNQNQVFCIGFAGQDVLSFCPLPLAGHSYFSFFSVSGFLIGYSVNHKPETPSCPLSSTKQPRQEEEQPQIFDNPQPSMDWSDVVELLNETLTLTSIQERIRYRLV